MLTYEITQQPDAIEVHFCKPFEKLERHIMDSDMFKMLAQLMIIPKNVTFSDEYRPFVFQVIEKRIPGCFTFTMDDERLMMFITYLAETPGSAIMYLTYLQYWCKKNNVKEIDLEVFGTKIFPFGFPSKEDLHKLWDATKVNRNPSCGDRGSDNLVDYQSAMSSIQFLPESTTADM